MASSPMLLVALVTIIAAVHADVPHGCQYGNHYYLSGRSFYANATNHCVIMHCSGGFLANVGKGCYYGNFCHHEGTIVEHEDSVRRNCTTNDGDVYSWVTVAGDCQYGNRYYPSGTTFYRNTTNHCVTNHCSLGFLSNDIRGCYYDYICHPEGTIMEFEDRFRHRCTTNDGYVYSWVTITGDCQYGDSYYTSGTTFYRNGRNHCVITHCSHGVLSNDIKGCYYDYTCHPEGTIIEYEHRFRRNCTTNDGDVYSWVTIAGDCQVGNVLYRDREIFFRNETTHCDILRCSLGDVVSIGQGCLYEADCFDLGRIWQDGGCSTLNCTKNDQDEFSVVPIIRQCSYDFTCYSVGTILNTACSQFNCTIQFHGEAIWQKLAEFCD